MLLHSQTAASISWEANGETYSWEAYGSCEVPEVYVPLLRAQGFPVSATPVVPRERARRVVEEQSKDESVAAVAKLKNELLAVQGKLTEAERSIESAERRTRAAAEEAKAGGELLTEAQQQLATTKTESAEFERLLAESGAELVEAKRRIGLLEHQLRQPAVESKPVQAQQQPQSQQHQQQRRK